MSCGLILAAALVLSDPAVVEAAPPVAAEAPASVASEPLFADLVQRSVSLKAIVDGWIVSGEADQGGFFAGVAYSRFKAQATDLAARDMAGHEDLKARDLDGDLGSDGSTPQTRAQAAGFRGKVFQTVAINRSIAINNLDVLNQWYYDPPTYAIMANCANTVMGVWSENSWDRSVVVAVYGQPGA